MQQAHGTSTTDEHGIAGPDIDLVLTAEHARQRLDEDRRVGIARVVEADQVASADRPGRHHDVFGEPPVESDADPLGCGA